jgi:hypothetical protein
MQGLEDRFDLKSRKRLEGFIVPDGTAAILSESEKQGAGEFVTVQEENEGDNNKALYFVTPTLPVAIGEVEVEERRVLSRLPLLAIFHGVSHERGVPPSFTGTHARPSRSLLATHSPSAHRFPEAMARAPDVWRVPDNEGAACPARERHRPIRRLACRGDPGLLRRRAVPRLPRPGRAAYRRDRRAHQRDRGALSGCGPPCRGARPHRATRGTRSPPHACVRTFPLCSPRELVLTPTLQHPALRAEEQKLCHGPSYPDRELPPPRAHRGYLRTTQ